MHYIQLKERLKGFTIFSLNDIRKINGSFHRRRLTEWQSKGYIKKIMKGYYVFSDLELSEQALFEIANRIYNPSYISFEIALSYYNLIPESVYGITSASTRRTYRFKTPVAEFNYKTVKPTLFFGYNIIKHNSQSFKIAKPEKALLDFFYINKTVKNSGDFINLRINKEAFIKEIDEKKLRAFLKKFNHKSLSKRTNLFLKFIYSK